MPDFALTFIFDIPGHGFTETHYKTFASDNLDAARDIAVILGQKRQAMSGEQCTLQAVRIANASEPGRVGKTYPLGFLGVTGKGSAASNVALNVTTSTFNNDHSSITQFRGFWDELEVTGGAIDFGNAAFLAAFNAWQAYYVQQQFGWRGVFANTTRNVTAYTVDPVTQIVEVTFDGGALPFGPQGTRKIARFSKINGKSKLNGTQVVVVSGNNTVQLVKPLALGPFLTTGTITVSSYTLRVATTAIMSRIGKRQAGAPLLRSRGRRPAQPRV